MLYLKTILSLQSEQYIISAPPSLKLSGEGAPWSHQGEPSVWSSAQGQYGIYYWLPVTLGRMLRLPIPVLNNNKCDHNSKLLLGTALPGFRSCHPPWLRLSQSWDHTPLRRQSLSPWQVCHLCPLHPAWPWAWPVSQWRVRFLKGGTT